MRKFEIVRFNHRYPDRSIVCDRCGQNLNIRFYYDIYENGEKQNEYPLHTQECARKYISVEIVTGPVEYVYVMDGSRDYLQEEATED